jgi:hypothetical protein
VLNINDANRCLGGRRYLVWKFDVAAAGGFVAPAPRHVANGIATAAEDKHGLAVPKKQILNSNRKSTQNKKIACTMDKR